MEASPRERVPVGPVVVKMFVTAVAQPVVLRAATRVSAMDMRVVVPWTEKIARYVTGTIVRYQHIWAAFVLI